MATETHELTPAQAWALVALLFGAPVTDAAREAEKRVRRSQAGCITIRHSWLLGMRHGWQRGKRRAILEGFRAGTLRKVLTGVAI